MNTKLTNILLIILLICNVVFLGSWWFGRMKMHRQKKEMSALSVEKETQTSSILNDKTKGEIFLVKTLSFDTNQQKKLDVLMEMHFNFLGNYMNAYIRTQTELFNALKENKDKVYDSVYVFHCADSLGVLKTDVEKELFRHFNSIKGICNNEQLPKFNELIDNISKEFVNRHNFLNSSKAKQDSL